MKIIFRIVLLFVLFSAGFFFASSGSASAAGISPSTIDAGELFHTARPTHRFQFSDTDAVSDRSYTLVAQGTGASYIVFNTKEIRMPAGVQQTSLDVSVVPEYAPNGAYEVLVFVEPLLADAGAAQAGASASTRIGAVGRIIFKVVGEEVRTARVHSARVQDTAADGGLLIAADIENTGTVDFIAHEVSVSVYNVAGEMVAATTTIPFASFAVSSGQRRELSMATGIVLPEGAYTARITAEDGVQGFSGESSFVVYPEGSSGQSVSISVFDVQPKRANFGKPVLFSLTLYNNGVAPYTPRGVIELFRGRTLTAVLPLSKESALAPGRETTFSVPLTTQQRGEYVARANFSYGFGNNASAIVRFRAGGALYALWFGIFDDGVEGTRLLVALIGGLGFLVLISCAAFFMVRRRAELGENTQQYDE